MFKLFLASAFFFPMTAFASPDAELIDVVMLSKSEPKSLEKIGKLLDSGASANAVDEDGKPVLHWAIYNKDLAVIKLLFQHGADVEKRDKKQDWTALMQAAYDAVFDVKSNKLLGLLIQNGAKVDSRSKGGTALMYVVSNSEGHPNAVKVAKFLLEHKADPNLEVRIVPDRPGITVLMNAAREGADEIARLLVKHGAKLDAKGLGGKTASDLARDYKHEQLAKVLTPGK